MKKTSLALTIALAAGFMGFAGSAKALTNATETFLHSFGATTNDGYQIYAGVTLSADGTTLYGTTTYGGDYQGGFGVGGTVFAINISTGEETILHSFGATTNDGYQPYSGVTLSADGTTLYGTTTYGGAYGPSSGFFGSGDGTVFAINISTGEETILYDFGATTNDGYHPDTGVTLSADGTTLYGTTTYGGAYGGTNGDGTVFAINISTGEETILHSFGATTNDGTQPDEGVTLSADGTTLYGTTTYGGAYGDTNGDGTVFAINISTGKETILHSFGATRKDGYHPFAGVTLSADGKTLYGTTSSGGIHLGGTVFAIKINTEAETILSSFDATTNDGIQPDAGVSLSADGKTLYGTTTFGGAYGIGGGDGTVFAININTGKETTLYDFGAMTNDGSRTEVGVTLSADGKTLYGTTSSGGIHQDGNVFAIDLSNPTPKPISPNLTFASASVSVVYGSLPASDSASSASTGAITYKSGNTNVATVSGSGEISFIGVGTTTITATQVAASGYLAATKTAAVKVAAADPSLGLLSSLPTNPTVGSRITIINPSSSSSGAFTFKSSNTKIAILTGKVIKFLKTGTTTITATQAAKGNYLSGKVSASVTVVPAP